MHEARLNGRPVGELAINAALAGTYDVPVALVSGDQALAAEAREVLGPSVETVVVKHAVGRFAARSVAPAEACRRIREGTSAALGRSHHRSGWRRPSASRWTSRSPRWPTWRSWSRARFGRPAGPSPFTHDDYREVFRAWRALYNLAGVK